ncbi:MULTISPECIES: helix-turn-helix transcriptional regulator [Streptomyces]|uniref:helix-turn-helix transcriptional regulator n=1 Tax=Streptomyces TaxID=1883 RepID=UPI00069B508F|nr:MULTISPECIES: helix-turn-helix domain-containing protein [Streptomyces]MYU57423.1 helix-turn-helix domain-containing protein [Streptomyces sp. SID7805]
MSRAQLTSLAAPKHRKLATAQELADYCGVPLTTVYQWSHRGGGPRMIKVGRHLRARWEDIERWLDAHATDAA